MSGRSPHEPDFGPPPGADPELVPGPGNTWIQGSDESQIGRAALLLASAVETIRTYEDIGERPYIVMLSGESGVGKTTLAHAMSDVYLDQGITCRKISADGYYQQPVREGLTNMRESTHGASVGLTEWDLDELQRDLSAFAEGDTIAFREMDWNTCAVSAQPIAPDSVDILVVDHMMAHLLSGDIAIRLTADPQRIVAQAERRDRLEDRETQGTPLLRAVREQERAIVADTWRAITHPQQLVLHHYEAVQDESDSHTTQQGLGDMLGALATMNHLGAAPLERIVEKLAALETATSFSNSYAELIWIEAGLRLLPEETASSLRENIVSDPSAANLHMIAQYLLPGAES